jgi:hypothetical protein
MEMFIPRYSAQIAAQYEGVAYMHIYICVYKYMRVCAHLRTAANWSLVYVENYDSKSCLKNESVVNTKNTC